MAKLLPYEKYTLVSPLSHDELQIKLLQQTLTATQYVDESEKRIFSFGLKGWSKPYWGYIRKSSFELRRLIYYHNFANPTIFGFIKKDQNGLAIQIKMRPEGFMICFISLCLSLFLYAFIDSLIQSIKTNEIHIGVIVGGGLFIFTYFFFLVCFKIEAVKSKKFLSNLFEEAEINKRVTDSIPS